MWKTILVLIVCISVVGVALGASGITFTNIDSALEGVGDSSKTLLQDISAISLFAFVASDFFSGANVFTVRLMNDLQNEGHYMIHYESYNFTGELDSETGAPVLDLVRFKVFDISSSTNPITEDEALKIYDRMKYPIEPFIEWERNSYDGLFGDLLNAFQYVAYILGMIWGALSLIVLVLIDTIVTAWELITAGLSIIGLKS